MREIKFRVWDGDSMFTINSLYFFEEEGIHEIVNSKGEGLNCNYDIMQFTGLKDSKGNDIYENDILQSYHFTDTEGLDHFINHAVKWSDRFNGWFALNAESMNEDDGSIQLFTYKRANKHSMKVIGSIYENQELLESEQ